MMTAVYAGAVLLLVAASAFFSASEMAFSSANRVRLEHMRDNGDKKAGRALHVIDRFDRALSAILFGNNLVNIASSAIGSLLAIRLLGEKYTWISTAVITVLVIIFGETIPKIVSKKNAVRYSTGFAPLIRFLTVLFAPVTVPVSAVTGFLVGRLRGSGEEEEDASVEELRTIIDTAENEKVFDEDESELISAAIDFSEISAQEVMTARVDLYAIDADDSFGEILEKVENSTYSRIPVYEESIDHIIGTLSVNHFLKALVAGEGAEIRALLLEPCFVYKTMKLPAVLSCLRDAKQHLAVVTDEYGGTLGVVSMEDVLEQLVGDIWDETDTVEEDVTESADGAWELDGDMPMSEFEDLLEEGAEDRAGDADREDAAKEAGWENIIDADDYDSETVGGWCIEMLGGFPKVGDSFTEGRLFVTVLEMEERRVRRVKVELREEA